jgi:hypothetical protein
VCLWAIAAVASISVPSCGDVVAEGAPTSPGVVAAGDGAVQVIPPACWTAVTWLSVSPVFATGEPSWSISAPDAGSTGPFTVGVRPDGYAEDVPLAGELPASFSVTLTGSAPGASFTWAAVTVDRAALTTDRILTGAGPVDLPTFAAAACP